MPIQKKICVHYFISGHVQGVWYRASAQKQALDLNITGWAQNLNDGRVEILACGDEEALNQLSDWLWKGPELANVKNVNSEVVEWEEHQYFTIKK